MDDEIEDKKIISQSKSVNVSETEGAQRVNIAIPNDIEARLLWLKRLQDAAFDAADEGVPDFPRMCFDRELISFSNED